MNDKTHCLACSIIFTAYFVYINTYTQYIIIDSEHVWWTVAIKCVFSKHLHVQIQQVNTNNIRTVSMMSFSCLFLLDLSIIFLLFILLTLSLYLFAGLPSKVPTKFIWTLNISVTNRSSFNPNWKRRTKLLFKLDMAKIYMLFPFPFWQKLNDLRILKNLIMCTSNSQSIIPLTMQSNWEVLEIVLALKNKTGIQKTFAENSF